MDTTVIDCRWDGYVKTGGAATGLPTALHLPLEAVRTDGTGWNDRVMASRSARIVDSRPPAGRLSEIYRLVYFPGSNIWPTVLSWQLENDYYY